jgi:hypothetical protein
MNKSIFGQTAWQELIRNWQEHQRESLLRKAGYVDEETDTGSYLSNEAIEAIQIEEAKKMTPSYYQYIEGRQKEALIAKRAQLIQQGAPVDEITKLDNFVFSLVSQKAMPDLPHLARPSVTAAAANGIELPFIGKVSQQTLLIGAIAAGAAFMFLGRRRRA